MDGPLGPAVSDGLLRLRAAASRQADALVAEDTLADLAAAVEVRRLAERSAGERRAAAEVAAADLVGEAERALAASREERMASEREAAALLATALAGAANRLAAAQKELDASTELLSRVTYGSRPARATPVPERTTVVVPLPATVPVAAQGPFLVPVLSLGRELMLRMLVFGGVVTSAWFWVWWLSTGHGTWNPGAVVVTALLACVFFLTAYFYFFVCRMTRPNPGLPVPHLRAAMVVTKAPSEPWPVLRRTLEAMLAQDLGRPYDVWLADERPSTETIGWCAQNGVQVSTRQGDDRYQRDRWPRRRRTKEGNLAYFYDHVGYERYDVVAQLDADHVPSPSYLKEMIRPFADERVGYVSAPSICDANAERGWTVRGRLFREAAMHGPIQAGSNDGYGPVCIGSHYAVRTAALREVGGLGPELAEDYSTTLFLQAGGWEGVFTIDAEAHGDGPESVEEMLRQELQWSRSLGTILVRWAPSRLRRIPWRARLRLGFALAFYLLQGLVFILTIGLPLVGVMLRASWGATSLAGFYVHMWPSALLGLATAAYLRRCRLLRPRKAKLWSWELMLFQLVRWPWMLWGFFQGMFAGLRSEGMTFKVTPKGGAGLKPLRVRAIVPTLGLGLLPTLVVVLVRDPGPALGLQVLAGLQAVSYLSCAVAVVALHLVANRRRSMVSGETRPRGWLSREAGGAALVTVLIVVLATLAALAWRVTAPTA